MAKDHNFALPPLEKRPLVTFALFAFNQENYICEAVEGALAQTYEPLEIILSDDCSTDKTFELMKELVANYNGPHRIVVRQNERNEGTARHFEITFSQSQGELFVVAAGDDISLPCRTETLVETWERAGRPSGVVHSGWETYRNSDGAVLKINKARNNRYSKNPLLGFSRGYWLPAAAPTCAYTRDVFQCFPPLLGGSIIEDAPLFLRAALIGIFLPSDEILVRVRQHEENTGTAYVFKAPHRWNRFMRSKLIAFQNMQNDLEAFGGAIDFSLKNAIEKRILGIASSTAPLLLPIGRSLTWNEKVIQAWRMLTAEAVASTAIKRLGFTLTFFEFSGHKKLKSAIRFTRGGKPQ